MVGICFIIYLIPNAVILYRWFGLSLMIFFCWSKPDQVPSLQDYTNHILCSIFLQDISPFLIPCHWWFLHVLCILFFSFSLLKFHFFQFLVSDFSCVNMARLMNGSLLFFLICKVLAGVIHYTEKDGWRHFCHACPFQEENRKCRAFHGGR